MMKVIKLGGRVQSDRALVPALAAMWREAPGSLCVVHGGGDEISAMQRALKREPSFINGRRVTTEQDIELVRMILSGTANKRLVAALAAENVHAVGISGEDGGLLMAEPIDPDRFGRSGRPISANVNILKTLLGGSFLPVISPVGTDATSAANDALNVNGDDAAAVITAALEAELWLVADVAGVMDANNRLIAELDQATTDTLVSQGTVNSGMHAKLEAGFEALNRGAARVRIAGLDALCGKGTGTLLSLTPIMT